MMEDAPEPARRYAAVAILGGAARFTRTETAEGPVFAVNFQQRALEQALMLAQSVRSALIRLDMVVEHDGNFMEQFVPPLLDTTQDPPRLIQNSLNGGYLTLADVEPQLQEPFRALLPRYDFDAVDLGIVRKRLVYKRMLRYGQKPNAVPGEDANKSIQPDEWAMGLLSYTGRRDKKEPFPVVHAYWEESGISDIQPDHLASGAALLADILRQTENIQTDIRLILLRKDVDIFMDAISFPPPVLLRTVSPLSPL